MVTQEIISSIKEFGKINYEKYITM